MAVAAIAVEDFVEWCRAHAASVRQLQDLHPVSENQAGAVAGQHRAPACSATVC